MTEDFDETVTPDYALTKLGAFIASILWIVTAVLGFVRLNEVETEANQFGEGAVFELAQRALLQLAPMFAASIGVSMLTLFAIGFNILKRL